MKDQQRKKSPPLVTTLQQNSHFPIYHLDLLVSAISPGSIAITVIPIVPISHATHHATSFLSFSPELFIDCLHH